MNIIAAYAKEFGLDPDDVYAEKAFDTVVAFLVEFKNRHEFEARYNELNKAFSKTT